MKYYSFKFKQFILLFFITTFLLVVNIPFYSCSSEKKVNPKKENYVLIARTLKLESLNRNQFLKYLKKEWMPKWNKLHESGLLLEQRLFETDTILEGKDYATNWQFLIISKLNLKKYSENNIESEYLSNKMKFTNSGVRMQRLEVLIPLKNSYIPIDYEKYNDKLGDIKYLIEYIKVKPEKISLNRYDELMLKYFGGGARLLIEENKSCSFEALKTKSIVHVSEEMPEWNQIHISGKLPEMEGYVDYLNTVAKDNPNIDIREIVKEIIPLRTIPRVDFANELIEFHIH